MLDISMLGIGVVWRVEVHVTWFGGDGHVTWFGGRGSRDALQVV